ncbi:SNF2 family DNA or RNA helicase [Bradyrhizobium sp. F1.4.3]
MTAGGPPLGRILTYVRVLERLRKREDSVSVPSFVDAVEEFPPKTVRSDLRALGVDVRTGSALDVHAAYWSIVKNVPAAEQREINEGARLSVPTADETLAKIPRSPAESHVANFGRGKESAVAAAQALDLSFDVAAEHPDLFLLGHGRMQGSHVAFRHQVTTARNVAEDMRGLAIVADEVGLGKTNVAALILEDILTEDPYATALVLVPANVKPQWIEEVSRFFGRELLSDIKNLSYSELESTPILLLSLDQAKGTGKDTALSEMLRKRMWDLLVVDEAHDCRNADRLRFRFVYSLRARRRVFLTATPIHNSGYDMFNLATLLKPGYLGQRRFFAEKHMAGDRIIKDNDVLQRRLAPLMARSLRRETDILFAKRNFTLVEITEFKPAEEVIYDELLVLLKGIYSRHMGAAAKVSRASGMAQHVSQFVLIAMLVLREMASHPLAAIHTLSTALRKRVEDLASITRDDSDLVKLDAFIACYKSQPWDAAHHAKSQRLLDLAAELFARDEKFIVYVNYLKTHELLMKALAAQNPDCAVIGYRGTQDQDEKTGARTAFKGETKACLISTDAGGQGLNLQFARTIVNYDFPWNPMRVEQRIGRVDRVGQDRDVSIYNFRTRGTVEEYVQIVLTKKLKECRSVLGEFMSPMQVEKVYEDKLTMGIGRALMESRDAADMRRRMISLGEDELRQYVGDYGQYGKITPPDWTWRPRS